LLKNSAKAMSASGRSTTMTARRKMKILASSISQFADARVRRLGALNTYETTSEPMGSECLYLEQQT
jgi:hypothetical protein